MLETDVREELRRRADRLTQKINDAKRHQAGVSNELAAITRDIESDQEMRALIQQRLDADNVERREASARLAEDRTARENDMLS